jgi:hypothetical protein
MPWTRQHQGLPHPILLGSQPETRIILTQRVGVPEPSLFAVDAGGEGAVTGGPQHERRGCRPRCGTDAPDQPELVEHLLVEAVHDGGSVQA